MKRMILVLLVVLIASTANADIYRAKVTKIVDGDTIDVIFDLGFGISKADRVRFYGVDTPELRSKDKDEKKAAYEAKDYVAEKVADKDIRVEVVGTGKFGRPLGIIYYLEGEEAINLNQELV